MLLWSEFPDSPTYAMNEILRLAATFFRPMEPTVDLGSGLDLQELNSVPSGGQVTLVSDSLLQYPGMARNGGLLPYLNGTRNDQFANALCIGSLNQIDREDVITAVLNLARILYPKGRALLSWHDDSTLPPGKLILLLESAGFQILLSKQHQGQSVVVAEKSEAGVSRGLERIQTVLAHEQKTATYKLALIRALAVLSRTASNGVQWHQGRVLVPMAAVARQWLIFYWPLLTGPEFIAQIRGETEGGSKGIAFRSNIRALAAEYGSGGLYDLLKRMDEEPERFHGTLSKLREVISKGPVQYSGTTENPVFAYQPSSGKGGSENRLGWIVVPEPVWLDLSRFDHWIEDSLVMRWAQLTADMNRQGEGLGHYLPMLLQPLSEARDTSEIRGLLRGYSDLRCVWTDKPLQREFEIDHLIPYSVWGNNDLWNLLPCDPRTNNEKRAQIPGLDLIRKRSEALVHYWQLYRANAPSRFERQLGRALGARHGPGWEKQAISGLMETVERLAVTRGLSRWSPGS